MPGLGRATSSGSPTSTDRIEETLAAVTDSIRRGCAWLTALIGPDGNPGAEHCHYYRVPWALALTGRREEASAVLSWVEREVLDSSGDLRSGAPRGGFEAHWASYPLSILASGAWHLERYDTADLIVSRLRAYQHPEVGGAYAARPDFRGDERQDLFPTAQLGMTGLTTGRLEMAEGAYRWMQLVYRSQPELPTRLYTATEGARLITNPGDEELVWQMVTDFTLPRQAFYNPGIAAAFLGRYSMRTGDEKALELARQYLDLTVGGSEAQFDYTDSVQVCKFAWGASVLLEATGEDRFLEYALRMADWFVAAQNSDGSWDNSPFLMARGGDRDSIRTEISAEFVQHLVSIATAAGGRLRAPTSNGVSN